MNERKEISNLRLVLSISLALFIFLWSLDLMGTAFQAIGNETVMKVISITSNPFISLFIGLFITAIIQSSSTSTSLIVGIVATGSMTLENAIPMVMGANIGTTLTSTIVSLGYITNNKEFKNAIAGGVMHDFFNIMTVMILFPLEYYYQVLTVSSKSITSLFSPGDGATNGSSMFQFEFFAPLNSLLNNIIDNKVLLIVISCVALFISIKTISKIIYGKLMGTTQTQLKDVLFDNPLRSFGFGTIFTAAVQSSSITTSIIVPLAATGQITLRKLFPYIIGANIGTTITALIAALNKSQAATSLALAHFLFNLTGTIIFLPFSVIRSIPVDYADKFGSMTMRYRIIGFFYILVVFFLIPMALIFINKI